MGIVLPTFDYFYYTRRGRADDCPRKDIKTFQRLTLRVCVPLMICSSCFMYGALTMAHTYAGRTHTQGLLITLDWRCAL